jgi:hypothetical protein
MMYFCKRARQSQKCYEIHDYFKPIVTFIMAFVTIGLHLQETDFHDVA